jgi:L-histidine Nalpha-methyltransferase
MYTSQIDNDFAQSVKKGLGSSRQKRIESKYFYDAVGSMLFEEICRQPEYYPWRVETSLLRQHSKEIVGMFDENLALIELGSGSSIKTRILLHDLVLKQPYVYYFPIDVSKEMLCTATRGLGSEFPNLRASGISSEYVEGINRANKLIFSNPQIPRKKLIIFFGSSIGNFEPKDSISFLQQLRSTMDKKDGLVVGIDLQKDKSVLEAAYNDSMGYTARFNLNLLTRVNRELGGNFDQHHFVHHAFYNSRFNRIEMHLLSTKEQEVYVGRLCETFGFQTGETIHTENSYKYSLEDIRSMAEKSQFTCRAAFIDEKNWFSLAVFSPC